MAINPPEGIADFLAFVSGMEWPEADEDLMRRVSEHYGAVARDLETVSGYVIELIPIVKNDFDGEAAESFLMAMKDLAGQTAGANQLEQTAELSRQLSEVALKVANQVEYTKIMAILQLVQLLAEILFATLFSAFTFGSVWGPVSALFAATREGLHQLFRWLLQTIISQTFIGIVGGVFQDTVIQLYQLGAGHTTSWNTESLIDSIKQGALSGVVAGPLEIFSHYGGKLLGRVLGGKTPGSIISKRIDDVLNKVDDKLDHITPNPKPDIPTGGAGPKSKLDDIASKSDKELPPTPPDKAPNDVTPPPAPPKTVTEGTMPTPVTAPVPAPSKAKPEAPGGSTAKDKPNAPATGTKTGAEETPTAGAKTGAQETPTPGGKGIPGADRTEIPNTGRAETPTGKPDTVGGKDAPGAGRPDAGDASAGGKAAKSSDSSAAGRTAGDVETPLDDLLPTKEARSAFAKDVGELLGGVSRNLETGFLRHGEGTIADSFTKKMGDVFSEHLGQAGAREAGEAFGEMLTRKWVRLGADHTELPELLTKAMGDFGQLAPLKNLADSMPNLFARSEHSNALARIFKQENPLQGSPMYQLGGAVASLLNEGTNEMLSEGFYNMIFGDGTFEVSGGPFASGVAMGALSHGLHRAFEPITVRYQNWVLSHQHADNPADSKYFGLLHPINIASFVSNMTGNPAPWPVPRPTSELQETSFLRDMKDMVEWVFSHPVTGTPFFTDLPQRSDVTVESGGAFTPLDLDLGPSFGDEIARDPLFRSESDDDALTNDGGTEEGDEGSGTVAKSSRATVSSDLSALLGDDTEGPVPDLTDQDRPATRPVTQGGGDRFSTPVPQETGSPARTEVPAQAEAAPSPRPHPLQAEKDRAAAEGLDYLLPYDSAYDDTTSSDDAMTPVGDGDSGDHAADDGDRAGDGTAPPPGGAVRDIPSGIAVGVLTPAQAAVLRSLPQRPGVFVVGMHTDPRTPHDPDVLLKALTDAHDGGRLDGITEIRFTACGLASPVHESTVRTVMSGLWKHRAVTGTTTPDPLMARAADAPVWYVPTTGGHLLTAQHVGLTLDGKIAVVDEGAWHVYGDSGDRDHTPVRTTPDADDLPDDAVRFLFRTPAVDAEHPDAVTFGRDKDLPVALSRHLPRERWTALLSDPAATDLLAEVTETRRSPDDAWHTMDAGTYLELQNQLLGEKGNGFSDETVENAFSVYPPELSADGAERLEAVVNLVRELHADTEEGPLTPAVQILLQRLLLDQGFPPARLPDAARTTTLWRENETGFLAAELTLGMADVTGARNTPLTGELTVAPAATPSDEALSELLQDPDESRKALLRELLDGAHLPDSPWHTLDGEAYLALRSRLEGSPLSDPGTQVRETLHRVFEEYGEALKRATTRVDQLKAVADTVLTLHATGGLTGSPESALTAHSRFLVPRMLLDLGITPVPLPAKLHAKPAWQAPRNAKMRNTRILTFATSVARAVTDAHPSWSRPLTFAPAEDDAPGVTPSGDRATDTGTGAPASSSAPVAAHTPAPQTSPARDGDGDAPEPTDWRAELDALGTRTREETTAFLVLPEPAPALVGRADRLLRTDDRPYTTLTKDLPPGTEHWLVVQVPAGHAVDTGEGRLLVGKDRLAAVTLTGPADTIGSLQDLERGLRPPGSPEQPLPLAVLSRVGQALYANPDHDEHHTVVRTAVRVAYAEASRDAERALGEYLTRREDVQRQVRDLVRAAWDKLSADERRRLGTAQNAGSGSVGDDLTTLEEVVENGNIRERMHLLVTGVHGPVRERLGLEKPKPEILTRERSADSVPEAQRIQQDADVVQNIKREQERLRAQEADNPGLEALLRAQEHRRRTELRPEEVVPPLSERERGHAMEEGRLTWEPGERHRQIALRTKSQVTAEATGGLMSAGTSNTTYFTLTVVHAMAKKWNVPVDFQLVRLALMADMLPIGHHTFHEVMTASEAFERDVLARQPRPAGAPPYADVLWYTDDWGRFRSLAPLTENTLREAMPGGRFPDEVALGLEAHERTPDVLASPPPVRRTLRALPDSELKALLDRTPGLTDRAAGLLREALGDGGNTSRDWRRLNADSYLDLRERVTRPDDAVQDPQTGVWGELDSIMERWYGLEQDVPPPDPQRQSLDSAFDDYYATLAGDPGDRTRLTALAELLLRLREAESPPSSDTDVPTALGVVAQRLLVDQGYPPALWGEAVGAPDFWPNDAPSLVRKLEAAIGEFTHHRPVRQTPTGIAVGPMNAAQSRVLGSLPPNSGVFVVGMHTDPRTPHDPDVLLRALTDAHDGGRLDGITEIRFTACGLASPVHESTVRTVMSGLWKHRAVTGTTTPDPLMARAADAPVWYVPTTGGHLLTAQHIGLTLDGKIAVVDEGAWHVYGDSGDRDHTPARTTPDADDLPDDTVRFLFRTPAVDAEHPDAVTFGQDRQTPFDNGEGSSSSQRQQTPLASSSETSTPPAPRAPWYVDGGKALGDGRVLSVSGPAQVTEALHEARTDLTKAGVDAETAAKVMKRLTPVLSSTDPGAWNDFLRDGTVFHANGRVVVVTARPDGLTHHTAQPKEQLAPYASRNQAVTNRAVSAGGNLSAAGGVDAVVKLANMTDVTGTIPSVKVQAGTTYAASRTATADTQGAGRTVLKEMHEFDGGVRVEVHVLDKDTTREREAEFAFPRRLRLALPEGTGASGDATTWKVVAPEALKSVLSTVNAIAPGPLLTGLASAMGRAGFTPDVTAAFVSKVATDFFNEKALKDGNQWWSTGSLTSGVFAAGGFPKKSLSGHFLVGAELTGLRRMDLTSGRLRVREDFSDAFGVKSSSRFGDKSGLTVGVSFLTNPDGPVVVPSVELAVNAARSHNFDVGGSDKTKVKLTHTEEEQVEYHATARFRVKFMSSSKRTALSFDSALDLAVGVPRSQAEAFEAGLLGPGRTELVPDPPRPDTPGTPPPSRFRAVGQAVRRLLRLARQEPSANFDVDAARPFPSRGMPDPAGLLEIAGRHPIEIAPSNGTLPDGAVWTSLRDHPRVVVVPATAVYSLAGATAPEAAFRYHVNALGEVTAAQRLRTSTFTELFGPLEPGDTGIARLTELSADRPWLGFTVRDDAGILLRIPDPPRAGALSLTVRKGDGGELDVQSALRHPVEQTVRDLAATDAAAEQPAQVLTDIMSELEDLAVRQRPLEVRIDERYEGFDTLTGRLAGHPHLLFREDTDPRRPAAYMMRVDGNGALSGPFRRRDFGSDPLEPPALASRTGLGPGVVGELPGSQKVLETALDWLDRHLERTGLKKRLNEVEYAQFHRELTAAFGATGMRARFPKLLGSGVPLVLKAGGQELRLHLRSELLDLRGAPVKSDLSLTRSVTRSANQTVGVGDQVSVSATVGGTLRFDTREGQRAEPGGKIGLGGTPSHVKDSVAATLKASREQETSGQHTVFTYTAVHHLTATVHDFRGNQVSGSSLRVEGEDVSAVVRVGDDHLANDSTAHRLSTGTVTEFSRSDDPSWLGASDPREFVLPRDGLGGIHPEFLSTRLLTGSVVTLVAGHGGARTPKPADEEFDRHSGDAVGAWRRGLTPELEEALTPNFLQSRFEQLTSPDGAVFPLPPDSSGHAQALVVRLRLGRPEHEGTGTGTSLTYTAETGTKSSTSRTRSFTYVGGLSIGGYASLAGKSVAATVSAEATRTRTKARTVASAGTGTSTATYKGTSHHYRADAYYEIIHHTWQPDGRFSTTPSDHSTGKLYVKVDGGVELTVPDHHARVLEMPGTGPRPAVSHGPRSYVDADLAKAVSHVEKLGADDVLTEIKNLFGTLKGIPDHLGGGAPTDFSRALETVFSPEALRADFAALSTTSVHQVIKLRQPGGGARMIGIQVTAEVGEPRYEGPRHQVTLAMGATATRSAASASGVSDKGGGQLSLTLRATDANGLSRGGAKIGAGADTSAGRTETVTTSERDQHSFEVTGTAQEFSHPVSYTVKIFDASEPHQLIRLAGAALNSPAQLIDRATDGRAGRWFAEQWGGEWEKVFPSGHKPAGTRTIADHEVRLLVPDHLTRPGATAPAPAEPVGRVRPKGPTAVTPEVQRLTEDLAPSVRALSLPGLGAVVKWLPTAAALPQRVTENDTGTHTREDLAPATLAGLRTDLLTTERNLRANIRQLLGGGYTVPVAGGEEVTVRMVVRRARHLASAEFDSNAETEVRERETEREQERTTLAWSGSITPDGPVATTDSGTPAGPGVAGVTTHLGVPVAIGGEQGTSLSTSRSETVDERAKKQRTQHYYTSDVTWVLTGSRRTTVEIEVDGGLIGLLHDDLIDGLAGRHDDLFQPKPAPQDEGATEHRDQGDGEGEDRNENQDRNQDGAKSAPEATRPSVVVTPPTGIGTGLSAVPGDASVPLGPTRPAPPATPPGPVPGVTITPPADTPLVPPVPVLRVTEYEAVGTVPRARRTGGARVEVLAEGADPIALALTGPPKDAASFPAYRPVRPVGPAEERPALQVSDDRRFAVPEQRGGAREFYATSDAVAEARSRLLPAAGTRLEADPESYVRFTLNGVEHTLLRVTVRGGGPGSVPLVLAGDAGGQHITLQGDPRPDRRGADMRRAVDTNLDHYGPELEAVAEKLEYADPGRAEPRTVLARALADLRRAREEGRDPAALERAEAEAVRAFGAAAGDEYGSPEDDWHLRLGRPPVAVALPPVDWSF
ncbi:hypothetical protein [Streptomyces sp. NPDC057418]|uniref:WXG100-like domain-containing protein n=1 Tax=Streptomyces sp. NPDC057418 TaxID=3346126 RepID=UPI00367CE46C